MSDVGEHVGKKRALRPLESFGIGRLITDEDFRVVEISEQSARLLGAEPEDLLSKRLTGEIGPRREVLEEAARGKIHLSECRTADGGTINVCFRVMKLNGGSDAEGFDVIFLKESDTQKCSGGESVHFHEVIHELDYNHAQTIFLERLLESTGHDLKTPLGVVLGYCELLFKGKANGAGDSDRIHRTIYRNCAWISEMVERLEEFTSIVKHCKDEKRKPVSFTQALRDSAGRLSRTSFATKVKLHIEGPESSDTEISEPPNLIASMADELLRNAILYSRSDREVAISVSRDGKKVCAAMLIPAMEEDAPTMNHLMERVFVQPPDFHKESAEQKPVCLGLGAVKYLVMMMGGTMNASSGPGESARIVVELPAQA
ncbi:MAG TPA: PAS domain-containing sensor histidine kinase [Acidobacteriota bacterium]|mgnify:FL=1|nr:PAS domain-containing sensor histidine kinase [Acidobacteriota bacterium]HNT16564.1 PAS domain-containing sensor histidine kinase [Acidobacteriota bacterium]HPA26811.1 PAS domain-containing sensor histidine kinase [Acidobacteriota bacterium]HQO19047.1 PAS domain-containing sensor histidine kinase [Acidobacteriota bacterium]HQQ45940.1 PAS domain-containing sensor histidine kinase [Acidobacteriota bacterium]